MSSYNFADQYKAAGLAPGPEIIRLRQASFDKLRKDMKLSTVLDLTRLYFGLPVPDGTDWFRDAFAEADASFSMIDNGREASVLSACLLAGALDDGNVFAGLVPVIAATSGNRVPLVRPEFIAEAKQALVTLSKNRRQHTSADISKIKQPSKSKVSAAVDAYMPTPDWTKNGEAIKLAANESNLALSALATQIQSVVSPLVAQVYDLREEVSMLWWYIGGWSRALEKPFADMEVGLAALMAGLDLANLTEGESGPVAAPAILQRLVVASRADGNKKITLKSAVEALPEGTFQQLGITDHIRSISDLCPVIAALAKANEIGSGAWDAAYKKSSGLDSGTKFLPIELAIQVYRESLLLAHVG
jgi:hypothetical protein